MKRNIIAITGATEGMGAAMTEKFAKAGGYQLILTARHAGKVNEMVEKVKGWGGEAIALPGDVTDDKTAAKIVSAAVENYGGLDVLINNAGSAVKVADFDQLDVETIDKTLNLNLRAVIMTCKAAVPQMKKQHNGLIINLTSACHKFAWPGWSIYSAAKEGVSMFSRCLYTELRPHGIYVSVLVPGACTQTHFAAAAGAEPSTDDPAKTLRAEHMAEAAYNIVKMPEGAVVPEMVVYGMLQEIVPF